MLADWKSRDLTQEDCADLAAYGNIPSTDNLPLVSGNQVVYFFISPYGSIQANRQYTKDRNTAFVPKVWEPKKAVIITMANERQIMRNYIDSGLKNNQSKDYN